MFLLPTACCLLLLGSSGALRLVDDAAPGLGLARERGTAAPAAWRLPLRLLLAAGLAGLYTLLPPDHDGARNGDGRVGADDDAYEERE